MAKGDSFCRFAFLRGTEWEEAKGKVTCVFTVITGWSFGSELRNLFSIKPLAHYLCVDIWSLLNEKQGEFWKNTCLCCAWWLSCIVRAVSPHHIPYIWAKLRLLRKNKRKGVEGGRKRGCMCWISIPKHSSGLKNEWHPGCPGMTL